MVNHYCGSHNFRQPRVTLMEAYFNLWYLLSQSRNPDVVPFAAPNQLFKGCLLHILHCLAGSCHFMPFVLGKISSDHQTWLSGHLQKSSSANGKLCNLVAMLGYHFGPAPFSPNLPAVYIRHLLTEVGQKKVEVQTWLRGVNRTRETCLKVAGHQQRWLDDLDGRVTSLRNQRDSERTRAIAITDLYVLTEWKLNAFHTIHSSGRLAHVLVEVDVFCSRHPAAKNVGRGVLSMLAHAMQTGFPTCFQTSVKDWNSRESITIGVYHILSWNISWTSVKPLISTPDSQTLVD